MPAQSCDAEVVKEATAAVDKTELKLSTQQVQMAICLEAFVLTFWQRRSHSNCYHYFSSKQKIQSE